MATLINLPAKALDTWALNYRENIANNSHDKAVRISWASVRKTFKRYRGNWIEKIS